MNFYEDLPSAGSMTFTPRCLPSPNHIVSTTKREIILTFLSRLHDSHMIPHSLSAFFILTSPPIEDSSLPHSSLLRLQVKLNKKSNIFENNTSSFFIPFYLGNSTVERERETEREHFPVTNSQHLASIFST